ncbi:hypothetical protein D3C87_2150900 [compost metagenome]
MTHALAFPSIMLGKETLFAQQMAAFFGQGKFRVHGKRDVSGFLKLKVAITFSEVSCEVADGKVFVSFFRQVSVTEV